MTWIARWPGTLFRLSQSQSVFSIYMFFGCFCMLCGGESDNIFSEEVTSFEKRMVLRRM